jgi:acyl-CoA oxidase
MTETNSNVKGIETTATYNHEKRTFTIHTPHQKAQKNTLVMLLRTNGYGFAKLIIGETDYGVNAFPNVNNKTCYYW